MKLISGIHHVSMSCSSPEQYAKAKEFYGGILGLDVAREWQRGIMFETGCGIIEIFNDASADLPKGAVRHFALRTEDVDACAAAVSAAGYEITVQPGDVTIKSEPPFPLRMAFCIGPVGEEIEFFTEK